jgi:hypothetical protein
MTVASIHMAMATALLALVLQPYTTITAPVMDWELVVVSLVMGK